MSVNNQPNVCIKFYEQEFEINAAEVPTVASSSIAVFNKAINNQEKQFPTVPLKDRCEKLSSTIEKCRDAKEHKVRNILFGVLRTALFVAVVAAGVVGTVLLVPLAPAVGALIPIATFLACCGLGTYYMERIWPGQATSFDIGSPFIWMFGGPFFPLYEELSKVSKLENEISKDQEEIGNRFPEFVEWYTEEYQGLHEKLENELEKIQESLETIQNLSFETNAGKADLEDKLTAYKQALADLETGFQYFSHFQKKD